jgi:aminoglycoside phosphotransferase (APT) family kinase protein
VRKIDARAKLLDRWRLAGGISARMDALHVQMGDSTTRKMIVRRPGERALLHNPHAAADEFRILQIVQGIGMKTQQPYLLDASGEIFAKPYLIVEYIEGEARYAAADANHCVTQIATQLARLHSVRAPCTIRTGGAPLALHFLPHHAERITRMLQQRPVVLDSSLDEARIRRILQAVWPLPSPGGDVLLHGDFWPGNLLWQGGELVAVIDWEDAAVGNPLADFATTRLDLLWIFGREALQTFSRSYQTLTRCDLSQLPYWDLLAALRSASRLAEWAAGWAELGRGDITEATMRGERRWFVEQAFARLAGK